LPFKQRDGNEETSNRETTVRTKDPKIAMLRALPALSGYTDRELSAVSSLVDAVSVEAGHILVREGSAATEVFIIVEGLATVIVRGTPVAKLGPGEFLGEMALLDLAPRSATVVAETSMRLLATDPRRFLSLVDHPGIARTIAGALAKRLRLAEGAVG
jgi:CRP/FNR family cyclic AMP-dependent transcriptional regulator